MKTIQELPHNILNRKRVKSFIKASVYWYSGYSMGETVAVKFCDELYEVKNTCKKYKIKKYNDNIRYGSLILVIKDGNHYSIEEHTKKGTESFLTQEKRHQEYAKARRLERKLELDFIKRGLVNEQTEKFALRKLALSAPTSWCLYSREEYVQIEHPTMADYRKKTKVTYHLIKTGDIDEVRATWRNLRENPDLKYRHSLYSESEYLEDNQENVVYRLSNNWFFKGASSWDIEGLDPHAPRCFSIGKARLDEFEREVVKSRDVIDPQKVSECKADMQENKEKIEAFMADTNLKFSDESREKFQSIRRLSVDIIEALDGDMLQCIDALFDEFKQMLYLHQ